MWIILDFGPGVAVFLEDLEVVAGVEGGSEEFGVEDWVEGSRQAGAVQLQLVVRYKGLHCPLLEGTGGSTR